jgi:hypothetical protein
MENHCDRWMPQTPGELEMVLRELEAVLTSPHFRNSKRYPALLRYVVMETLAGNTAHLKERTLGIEVFQRPPDYDTNADPVVRLTAGEVRKRIAQYYQESGDTSPLRIGIPLGSYAAELRLRGLSRRNGSELDLTAPANVTAQKDAIEASLPPMGRRLSAYFQHLARFPGIQLSSARMAILLVLLGLVAPLAVYALRTFSPHLAFDKVWSPMLKQPGSVLMVAGNGPRQTTENVDPLQPDGLDHVHGPYNHVSVCEAIALSRLAHVMGEHAKAYEVKEADLTRLEDMRSHSTILVGALNNVWSMQLIEPLRFHFLKTGNVVKIVDRQNPQNSSWSVDYIKSYSAVPADYAIIARYQDPTTNGPVLIIAGIGAHGTEAAAEFLSSSRYLDQIRGYAKSSRGENVEMVIKTNIVSGSAGPPQLVSFTSW